MSSINGSRVRFPAAVFRILKTGAASIVASFDLTNLTASRTITLPDKAGTLAMTSDVSAAADVTDNVFRISDNGDNTKKIAFEASGIDASTIRTITAPNRNHTLGGVELWATATKYIIGDVVGISYLGSVRFYRCTTAHTAAAAFATDIANWTFLGALQFEAAAFGIMQTADPTKVLTFDPSLLTASRSVTVPDKSGTMAMLSDIVAGSVSDTQFLYRQGLLNSNFDLWNRGATSFTNPASGVQFANEWTVRKANGGGTAPSVNISRDTTIYSKLSKYSCKLDVTAVGTANATMQYEIYQSVSDFERYQGRSISMALAMIAPTASETVELCIDDGVTTTLHSAKTITNSWAVYKFENVTISASATKLEFILRLAGGTGLSIPAAANFKPSTTGAFYFGQCQLNDGSLAIDFKPFSVRHEQAIANTGYGQWQDQKAANTNGGTLTSGSWETRTLNTEVQNTITGASLASNKITLPAGFYRINAKITFYGTYTCRGKLYNVTDSADIILGNSMTVGNDYGNTNTVQGNSHVTGLFYLSKTTEIDLRSRVTTSVTTYGGGVANNFGGNETYTSCEIFKLA